MDWSGMPRSSYLPSRTSFLITKVAFSSMFPDINLNFRFELIRFGDKKEILYLPVPRSMIEKVFRHY